MEYKSEIGHDEENREETSLRLIRFMEKIHAAEVFQDETSKRNFINNLDGDQFLNLLQAANALVRGFKIKDRAMDGENVHLSGEGAVDEDYFPPAHEDKVPLFQDMLRYAKRMNADGRTLKDIALLVSASINAIHLFLDGNGRVSRLVYVLLTEPYQQLSANNYDDLRTILGQDGRWSVDINPGLITSEVDSIMRDMYHINVKDPHTPLSFWDTGSNIPYKREVRETIALSHLSEDNKSFIEHLFTSHEAYSFGHGFLAVYTFLKDRNQIEPYTKTFHNESGEVTRTVLIAKPIIETLTDEDVEDVKRRYAHIKRLYVRTMMHSVYDPTSHIVTKRDGSTVTVKDEFEDSIERHKILG